MELTLIQPETIHVTPSEFVSMAIKEKREYGRIKEDYRFTYYCYRNFLSDKVSLLQSVPFPSESILRRIEELTKEAAFISFDHNFEKYSCSKKHTQGRSMKRKPVPI